MKVSDGTIENGLKISRGEIVEVGLNGVVNDTTVLSGGTLSLLDGSYAAATAVKGKMYIYTGAVADDITVNGELYVKGGTVHDVDVEDYASMTVSSGAVVNGLNVSGGYSSLTVDAGVVITGLVVDGEAKIDITVSRESQIYGSCGGREFTVCDGVAENITVSFEINSKVEILSGVEAIGTVALPYGELIAKAGSRVINTEIETQAYFTLAAGAVAENSSFGSGAVFYFNGSHRGTLSIDNGCYLQLGDGASVDFTVAGRTVSDDYLITNINKLENKPTFTMTVSAFQAGGTYKLATGASAFFQNVTIGDGTSVYGVLTVNGDELVYGSRSYKLICAGGYLTLEVVSNGSDNFTSAQWKEVEAATSYVIEYSKDNFATAIQIVSETNALNTAGLAAGTYQWRVKTAGSDEWTNCEDIVIAGEPDTAQLYEATDDGKKDIFFASVDGKWRASHKAYHSGTIEFGNLSWEGTNEVVRLSNKGKIVDCFAGAGEDANTLYLTDNSNGDALFVDDIFSEQPDAVTGQARIAQIREICGGAGDDLIDMTSQRFFYTGSGVVIRGGDGNDTIWANKGENILLGDAGADRLVGAGGNDFLAGGSGDDSMHGGGGDDIFTFCANWGRDTIEQLASGSVTLWFENEMELSFEESASGTLISAADGSSILVKNMSVSLDDCRFGSIGFEDEFARLSSAGAFEEYSSTKIFTITA